MRTDAKRCIAALVLAGISLAGCETIPSDASRSFSNFNEGRLDTESLLRGSSQVSTDATGWGGSLVPRPKPESADSRLLAGIRPQIIDGRAPLECVPFARDESGIEIRGDAKNWWKLAAGKYTRSRRPQEGAVMVIRGYKTTRRGHVAVVRQILDDRTIVVDHANWGNDGRIYLSAPVRDESRKNDWSRIRVWYTPGEHWGERIYRAKGFIYPTTAVAAAGRVATLVSGSN